MDELSNGGVERLGILDIERVRCCRDRLHYRVGNPCGEFRGVMLYERTAVIPEENQGRRSGGLETWASGAV